MDYQSVVGTILRSGSPWADALVRAELLQPFAGSAEAGVPSVLSTRTGNDGTFTLSLAVPPTGTAPYVLRLPDGTAYRAAIAKAASATQLADIIAAAAEASTTPASDLMRKSTYDPNADGVLAIAQGGTGASSAAAARENLGAEAAGTANSALAAHNANASGTEHGSALNAAVIVHGTRPSGLPNSLSIFGSGGIVVQPVGSPQVTGLMIDGSGIAGGGGVTSFNSRTGAVVPANGDYTAAMVTGAARTDAANTFTAGPQVMVGGVTVQQSGGTAGTDEVRVRHTGSRAEIQSYDGGVRIIAPNGTNYLEVYDHAGNVMLIMNGSSDLQVRGGINSALNPDIYTLTSAGRWICRGPYDFRHPTGSGIDAGLARDAAGVVRISDGSSGRGSLRALNLDATGPITPGVYTFAAVPSASANTGGVIRISDRSGRPAYSDGTNWRWFADDAIIS